MGLRKNVIRLASQNPELRKHLVPILRKTAYSYSRLKGSFKDLMPGASYDVVDDAITDILGKWEKLFIQWVKQNTRLISLADMDFKGTIQDEGTARSETRTRDPQQSEEIDADYEVRAAKGVKGQADITIPLSDLLDDLLQDAISKTKLGDDLDRLLEGLTKKRTTMEDLISALAESSAGSYNFLEKDKRLQELILELAKSDAVEVEFNDSDYDDAETDYELQIQTMTVEISKDDPVIQGNKVIFSFDVEAIFRIVM